MWVTRGSDVGHIRIVLWVSVSSGSTGMTHFQPCTVYMITKICICTISNNLKVNNSSETTKGSAEHYDESHHSNETHLLVCS